MAQYEIEVDSQDEFYETEPIPQLQKQPLQQQPAAQIPIQSQQLQQQPQQQPQPMIRSVVKKKGRGFSAEEPTTQVLSAIKHFDTVKEEYSGRALRSVEGWVIFVSNLNEEVSEEDVQDKFADFGKVKDVRLNLDHRSGYVKGYALVEFEHYKEAVYAIETLNGTEWLGNHLTIDFCFIKPSTHEQEQQQLHQHNNQQLQQPIRYH